jgi:hypothetical protein
MLTTINLIMNELYHAGKTIILWCFLYVVCIVTINLIHSAYINTQFIQVLFALSIITSIAINHKRWSTNYVRILLIIVISAVWWSNIFRYIRDISVDGNTYHLQAIIDLYQWFNLFDQSTTSIWLAYYPKTIEILFAWIGSFFNNPDQGRILKIMLIIITYSNIFYIYNKHVSKNTINSLIIAAIITLNPVVLYQFFTLYIDDVLYLLFINSILYWINKDTIYSLLAIALVVSSKISHLIFWWLGLIVCIIITSLYYHQTLKEQIIERRSLIKTHWSIKSLALIIIILFWLHQYIINWYYFHNPLYGFMWEWKKDIVTMFQPPKLRNTPKRKKFVIMYSSYSSNYCVIDSCLRPINIFSKAWIKEFASSYKAMSIYDPNINGFWNLFWIILLIAWVGSIYYIIIFRLHKKYITTKDYAVMISIWYIVLCSSLLPFVRARYVPVLYLLPLLFIGILPSRSWLVKVVVLWYLCNIIFCLYVIQKSYYTNAISKREQIYFMETLTNKVNSTYHVSFTKYSFFKNKFLSFYDQEVWNSKKIEVNWEDFLYQCGIKSINEVNSSYNRILACPNWGYALRWDYWWHTDDYFYLTTKEY